MYTLGRDNIRIETRQLCQECFTNPHSYMSEQIDGENFKKKLESEGVRADGGKLAWHLVPMHMLEGMVRVLMHGAVKYAPHNWRKGLAYSRVTNSLQRHLNAFNGGEELDPESGLPHADHILCNALFLKGMTMEHPELDDRYKKPITSADVLAAAKSIKEMKNPFADIPKPPLSNPHSQADHNPTA